MSVNLFAFIQKGARTIKVAFQGYDNVHTYLTNDPRIQVGSFVVVPYMPKSGEERLSVAQVRSVDSCVKIDVNDHVRYKWVIAHVDLAESVNLAEREAAVLAMIEEAQRRKAVAELVGKTADSLPEADRNALLNLIGD